MPAEADDDDAAVGGQSLYADEDDGQDGANADPNEFDQRPKECEPIGPAPSFELVSEFFEILQDLRSNKRGAKGSAEKKRATIHQMFIVSLCARTACSHCTDLGNHQGKRSTIRDTCCRAPRAARLARLEKTDGLSVLIDTRNGGAKSERISTRSFDSSCLT